MESSITPSPAISTTASPFSATISNLLDRLGDVDGEDMSSNITTTSPLPSSIVPQTANTTSVGGDLLTTFLSAWWHEKQRLSRHLDVLVDKIRSTDIYVLILFVLAIVIAFGGLIAIICQLRGRKRRRKERELRYDTERWLDYSFSREKLTPKELSNLCKSKLWQNCVSPLSYKNGSTFAVDSLYKPKTLTVDINRNITTNEQINKEEMNTKDKDKQLNKSKCKTPECLTKCLSTSASYELKKTQKKIDKEPKTSIAKRNKNKKLKKKKNLMIKGVTSMHYDKSEMCVPLYNNSLSSCTTNRSNRMGVTSLQRKEYETQTLEMDLTGSDDDDITNPATKENAKSGNLEAIYEKLKKPSRLIVSNVVYSRPKSQIESSGVKLSTVSTITPSSRLRQQVPPGAMGRNISSQFQASRLFENTVDSSMAKNPLYNEPSDIEELIMFESLKRSSNAVSGSFKQNVHYDRIASKEPVVYSTFIKPKVK